MYKGDKIVDLRQEVANCQNELTLLNIQIQQNRHVPSDRLMVCTDDNLTLKIALEEKIRLLEEKIKLYEDRSGPRSETAFELATD